MGQLMSVKSNWFQTNNLPNGIVKMPMHIELMAKYVTIFTGTSHEGIGRVSAYDIIRSPVKSITKLSAFGYRSKIPILAIIPEIRTMPYVTGNPKDGMI